MFEIIGLLIATGVLLAFASIVSVVLATLTWLLMRKRSGPRKSLITAAILIPILSAAYIWLCVAHLPGKSLFGDISEPLPNGYIVEALGKMPDFASISNPKFPLDGYNGLTEYIGKLAVDGPFVVGQYSHPFGGFEAKPNEPFFMFDTRSGKNIDIPTLNELQNRLGHPIALTEVQYFRSPLAIARRRKENWIEFGPPVVVLLLFILSIPLFSRRINSYASNIYT